MLCWGIKHIATNHNLHASTDYMADNEVCIFGGCNVPTLADVRLLCADCAMSQEEIDECVEGSDYGIDVWIPEVWWERKASANYVKPFHEFWRRMVK